MPKRDPRFAQIVRSNLDIDAIADADANKVLAHLAGNMCEHFVTVGKSHTEHCSGKHLGHRAFQFNRFFFRHSPGCFCACTDGGSWRAGRAPIVREPAMRSQQAVCKALLAQQAKQQWTSFAKKLESCANYEEQCFSQFIDWRDHCLRIDFRLGVSALLPRDEGTSETPGTIRVYE